ncbi:hypothetical protein [Sphingomonas nostoxanthinifaciens]|uniref:hypothetical protein n=1 Tax=Sphingomonas nostoxanthinifaciens TaxID=2872652 RepID=UPI001CC1E418|nr:hypothetical protein [Sphingomonas nostoxanthinifaciens]UAK25057.1 hypothetical protein K8P63_02255 [Sphingomonas nostoxanthinifaciens]
MESAIPSAKRYLLVLAAVFVCAFGAVWAFTLYGRAGFLDMDYGQWTAKAEMLKSCDVGEVAIIGDSRAAAGYAPAMLGTGIRNLALTGATPVETYFQAKRIAACPRPPRVVIVSFSPRQYFEMNWLWLHAVSYGQLGFGDLQQIAADEHALHRSDLYHGAFGSEPPPPMKNWMYAYHFPPYDFASLIGAHLVGRRHENAKIEADTLRQGGQHVNGIPAKCATGLAWEATQKTFTANPLVTLYLQRMLKLFADRHIAVVFGPTPMSAASMRILDPAYAAGYRAYLMQQAAPYANARFAPDLLTTRPDCAFGDAHHLNQAGAEAFSRDYAPELGRLTADIPHG